MRVIRVNIVDVVDLVDNAERVREKKAHTVSVRIEEALNSYFEEVCKMLNLDKSEFLRTSIEILCEDNQILLKHRNRVSDYIEHIKDKMAKLPKTIIEVGSGSWKTMKDIAIVMLADEFWAHSEKFWNLWKKICDKYQIIFEDTEGEEIREFTREHFLDLEDLGMLIAGQSPLVSVSELLRQEMWADDLELRKITLVLAMNKAVDEYSMISLVDGVLQVVSGDIGKPIKMSIDAEGKFTRTLKGIIGPIGYVEIKDHPSV